MKCEEGTLLNFDDFILQNLYKKNSYTNDTDHELHKSKSSVSVLSPSCSSLARGTDATFTVKTINIRLYFEASSGT